jgi:hypothetical protein
MKLPNFYSNIGRKLLGTKVIRGIHCHGIFLTLFYPLKNAINLNLVEFCGPLSSVNVRFILLEYDNTSMGNRIPTLRGNV